MTKHYIVIPFSLMAAALLIGAATVATDIANFSGRAASPVASQNQNGDATIAIQSVIAPNTAAAAASRERIITWQSGNFPSNAAVTINLLRKTSDKPVTYSLVRTIAKNTANDGIESWIPAPEEKGLDLYIEVTCPSNPSFTTGCRVTTQPIRAF